MIEIIQQLDWDSDVFGYKVARILPERMSTKNLDEALNKVKQSGIRLVYWASDSNDMESQKAATACGGFLADHKVTYLINLATYHVKNENIGIVESYQQQIPSPDLMALALQAGNYSRFQTDPKITQAAFEKIYTLWITNSVNKQIATDVLIQRDAQEIIAMVTLGEKNGRGDIGLVAVSEKKRGQGIGKNIVAAALNKFKNNNYNEVQVVTQIDNKPACHLYERCGFTQEKVENFYHFWLG